MWVAVLKQTPLIATYKFFENTEIAEGIIRAMVRQVKVQNKVSVRICRPVIGC